MPARYDVCVVGAGPGGTIAAREAARGGARTILLDRKQVIGEPVQCGEYFPAVATAKQMMPHATGLDDLFGVTERHLSKRTPILRIISPGDRAYDLPFDGYSMDRVTLEQDLARQAEAQGAEVRHPEMVRRIRGSEVTTTKETIEAKVVIGADGPRSVVRKSLGLPDPELMAPCIQWGLSGDYEPVTEIYFGSIAPGGYAWVIPKCDGANVGLGIQKVYARDTLRRMLDKFVARRGLGRRKRLWANGGWVPCSGPIHATVKGNGLLVGDAAGMVMCSNGGGIATAMLAGREAGAAAAEHVREGAPLARYETRWKREMGEMLVDSYVTKKWADLAFGSDLLVELAMRVLGVPGILRAISCQPLYGILSSRRIDGERFPPAVMGPNGPSFRALLPLRGT